MPAVLYGAPSSEDDNVNVVTVVVKDGEPVQALCGPDDVMDTVELWLPSSEKRRLEERIKELEGQLRENSKEDVHWKVKYLCAKDRLENPHLYDKKGCPTPEGLEEQQPKGGLIYGVPLEEHMERRRVVTLRERVLELGSAFHHRSRDENLSAEERSAWRRAYIETMVLRHHAMDHPDLPLCLKCGGTGEAFPSEWELTPCEEHSRHTVLCTTEPMYLGRKSCICQGGFDPDADINDVIDD
jgi:hypothetical protein